MKWKNMYSKNQAIQFYIKFSTIHIIRKTNNNIFLKKN